MNRTKHHFWVCIQNKEYGICFLRDVDLPCLLVAGVAVDIDNSGEEDFVVSSVTYNLETQVSAVDLSYVGPRLRNHEIAFLASRLIPLGWQMDGDVLCKNGESISLEAFRDRIRVK